MPLELMLLIGFIAAPWILALTRPEDWQVRGLRILMKREIARHPGLSDDRIDRALLAAEARVYRGSRRTLTQLPGFAAIVVGYLIARMLLPASAFDLTQGGWLTLLAEILILAPGIAVSVFTHRAIWREMAREFHNRLPESLA